MSSPYRILCVEDDPEIGRLVSVQLEESGYAVDWVQDGALGLRRFREHASDLVILDLMLPSLDGLEICRRIREHDRRTPLIMLTAKAALRDVVLGLEMGADDYITKPFRTQELVARVQAILRRLDAARESADQVLQDTSPIQRGSLVVDPLKHKVTLRGTPVALTAKEFALLALFAGHPGRSFSRGDLLNEIWGPEFDGFDHTVNTHINRLRAKIEDDPGAPRYIRTVWGVGYRFAEIEELGSVDP